MYLSGIKHYCQNYCKGDCCKKLQVTCSGKCDENLFCSLFLCDFIEAQLINSVKDGLNIVDLLRKIDKQATKAVKEKYGNNVGKSIYTKDPATYNSIKITLPDLSLLENPERIEVSKWRKQ